MTATDVPSEIRPSVADRLRNAKEILQSGGWIQGAAYEEGRGRCLIGAFMAVTNCFLPDEQRLEEAVVEVLPPITHCNGPRGRIIIWNDEGGRNPSEVWEVLDRAIEREESRHG